MKKDISDLSPIIPIVQNIDFIIFSAVKPAILLPKLLYRRFVGIFGAYCNSLPFVSRGTTRI